MIGSAATENSLEGLPVTERKHFFKKILFIFRERGREGEREGEKHQYAVASHMPSPGDLAHNPGMCPRWGIESATLWFTGWHLIH